ncbi:hypothetical protein [Kosakonia radicincitans]|nr:hypothetical protein [Kosakonia radicincitans]
MSQEKYNGRQLTLLLMVIIFTGLALIISGGAGLYYLIVGA